ncbi:hypothetical protein IQ266_17905 [filamentous cyanobacterium LEGE 11480]|uniref:Uncharacterized protein n=1 Tax=Romeriopsis navalis LEGE 11480 TaxID=2777977 RepID=A0A928VN57_9CYAN|nr:hypothetical protein [Romeriopsis navalis]MBE9031611.1 hypothetical protein [Romeriopsis navalis LEGE 11480]
MAVIRTDLVYVARSPYEANLLANLLPGMSISIRTAMKYAGFKSAHVTNRLLERLAGEGVVKLT